MIICHCARFSFSKPTPIHLLHSFDGLQRSCDDFFKNSTEAGLTAAWHRVALSLLVDLIILDADVGSLAKLAAGALRMEVGIRQVGATAAETLLPRIAETAMVLGTQYHRPTWHRFDCCGQI